MFEWNAARVRFMADAAEKLGFYNAFADRVARHLPAGVRVCDAGCGLGYLSLALAARGYAVTAADVSQEALTKLRNNIAARGVGNIEVLEGDVHRLPPETLYDAMVFCFFGNGEETLRLIRAQCGGTAFLFKKHWKTHRFDGEGGTLGAYTYERTAETLEGLGIPFASEFFTPELGQPFRSLADAETFFTLYSPSKRPPDDWEARLTETGDEDFPLLLSEKRPVGLIRIRSEDVLNR